MATIYKTKQQAKAAWYDTMPGRNDRATYRKVKGGWIIQASNPRGQLLFRTRAAAVKYAREHGAKRFSVRKLKRG
jgi:hypothetical protein